MVPNIDPCGGNKGDPCAAHNEKQNKNKSPGEKKNSCFLRLHRIGDILSRQDGQDAALSAEGKPRPVN